MNNAQVRQFALDYFRTTGCTLLEESNAHVKVKLSPEADRDLTGRTYYWNFVDRTGAEPETMTMVFVFDSAQYERIQQAQEQSPAVQRSSVITAGSGGVQIPLPDSVFSRSYGVAAPLHQTRTPTDTITYGSRRLEQLFDVVGQKGRYIQLYEQPAQFARTYNPMLQQALYYETWLVVNFRVEFACDMKRDELHSLGINLHSAAIREHFHALLTRIQCSELPTQSIIVEPAQLTMRQAFFRLEHDLGQRINQYDTTWAIEATFRLKEELNRVDRYYKELLYKATNEEQADIHNEYSNRVREIEWQYQPRVNVSVVNGGLFHLLSDTNRKNAYSR